MTVKDICEKLDLNPICEEDTEREISGVYTGDLLSWVMGKAKSGNIWVTIMSNINVCAVASLCDVSMVILSEGCKLDPEALSKASFEGINVYSTEMTSFEVCAAVAALI